MELTGPAATIWDMCEQYIELALTHLALGGPYDNKSSDQTFDKRPEALRVCFLFPRIADKGFQALLNLRREQWLFRCVSAADKRARTISSAHSSEQVQARFETAKTTVEAFLSGLSPVQREIIR